MENEPLYVSSYDFWIDPDFFSSPVFLPDSAPEELLADEPELPEAIDLLHFDPSTTTFVWAGAAVVNAYNESGERTATVSIDRLGVADLELRDGTMFVDGAAIATFGGTFKLDESSLIPS